MLAGTATCPPSRPRHTPIHSAMGYKEFLCCLLLKFSGISARPNIKNAQAFLETKRIKTVNVNVIFSLNCFQTRKNKCWRKNRVSKSGEQNLIMLQKAMLMKERKFVVSRNSTRIRIQYNIFLNKFLKIRLVGLNINF